MKNVSADIIILTFASLVLASCSSGSSSSIVPLVPGDNMPGDNMPGDNMPGDNMPGDNMPGDNMPGDNMPGDNMPDDDMMGDDEVPIVTVDLPTATPTLDLTNSEDVDSYRAVAYSKPLLGSVTQGSKVDAEGVTEDHIGVVRDEDGNPTFTITPNSEAGDVDPWELTPEHLVVENEFQQAQREENVDRRIAEGWDRDPQKWYRQGQIQGAVGDSEQDIWLIEWSNDDDTFYLAGGTWVWKAQIGDGPDNANQPFARGAWLDGDETDLDNFDLPTEGSATYTGFSDGSFRFTTPDNADRNGDGGLFFAEARFTANFGTNQVGGELSNFLLSTNDLFFTPDESDPEQAGSIDVTLAVHSQDMVVTLGAAAIGEGEEEGFFTGGVSATFNNELLTGAEEIAAGDELTGTGNWGGQFYGNPAETGNAPPAVGGTWAIDAASAANEDGDISYRFVAVGHYGAHHQEGEE